MAEYEDLPCVCGDPEGELLGCHHPLCASQAGNPENPACACGGIGAGEGARTLTSTGGSGEYHRILGTTQILYLKSQKTVRGVLAVDDGLSVQIRGIM